MQWFRFYHEVLDDPKVQMLDPVLFKHWVNILCLAARNDGKLPALVDVAFALRIDIITLDTVLERLLNATLIAVRNGGANGSHIAIPNWEKRQYKSDTSTERVKRFRKRSETFQETAPETETETECSVDKSTDGEAVKSVDPKKAFWDNAKAYLGKKNAGMIGKWVRDYGQEATARAITEAQLAGAVDPVAYIEKTLRRANGPDKVTVGI